MDDLSFRRGAFWDTSSASGRVAVWQALRVACDALLLGDVELASSIIESSDLVVPRGDLAMATSLLVYDSLGAAYEIPRFVYSTPGNIVSADEFAARAAAQRPAADPNRPVVLLEVTLRLASTGVTREQDVKLSGIPSNTSVATLSNLLDSALAGGKHDIPPEATNPKPNVWAGRGLPAARQRIMFR